MAFPVVESKRGTGRLSAETTSPILYPLTISAGALLVCIFRSASAGAIGWPSGWNEIVEDSSDASDDVTAIAWRAAVGDEDGLTFAVTHGSGKAAAIVYSITGAEAPATQPPQLSTVVVGSSATPNPTTCTPTGGAKDYLWLWLGGWEGEQTTPPASTPTNYSNSQGAATGTTGVVAINCRVASAQRDLNAASEDPGSWTISVSDDWSAWTMAVHPAGVQTFYQSSGGASLTSGGIGVNSLVRKTKSSRFGNASMSIAGALTSARKYFKAMGGASLTIAGAITRKTSKLAGNASMVVAGTLSRKTFKSLMGSMAIAGVLVGAKKRLQAVGSGAIAIAGVISRKIGKPIGGASLNIAGTITRKVAKSLTASMAIASTLATQFTSGGGTLYHQAVGGATLLIYRGTLIRNHIIHVVSSGLSRFRWRGGGA